MDAKNSLWIISLAVLIAGLLSIMPSQNAIIPNESGLSYNSRVCVYKNEDLVDCGPNLLVNTGNNTIMDLLTGSTTTEVKYIVLCNATNATAGSCDTPAAADTALDGQEFTLCGLARAAGTIAQRGTGNFSYSKVFTATCNSLVTNVTGLFNSTVGAGDVYFAGNTFTSVTLQSADQLNVTWYIWVT